MDGPSPARLYASLAGATLLVAGIVGFFYSASFGSPGEVEEMLGALAVNGWSNALHALAGAVGLLAADRHSRGYSLGLGAVLIALALWGFALGGGGAILGFLPVNAGTDLLHLLLGACGVWAALATPAARARPGAAT